MSGTWARCVRLIELPKKATKERAIPLWREESGWVKIEIETNFESKLIACQCQT